MVFTSVFGEMRFAVSGGYETSNRRILKMRLFPSYAPLSAVDAKRSLCADRRPDALDIVHVAS